MAWSAGPGELTQVAFGATTVTSDLIEGWNVETEPDSYDAANGLPVDRGSVRKTITANVFDVSAIAALHTLMTARTATTITPTYVDAQTQAINETLLTVTPLLNNVTDVCKVWYDNASSGNDSLTGSWEDCGVTLDVPTISYSFPFEGTDGCGRPYFSSAALEAEFMLPTDVYSIIDFGVANSFAFALPDGNFMVLKGGRSYRYYANEDGSMPRAVRVIYRATADSWGDLIEFTDGAVSATTEAFNASSPTLMQDRLHGITVNAVGFGYAESEVTTF